MIVLVLENVHDVVSCVLIPSEHLATGTPYSRSSARVGLCSQFRRLQVTTGAQLCRFVLAPENNGHGTAEKLVQLFVWSRIVTSGSWTKGSIAPDNQSFQRRQTAKKIRA
jgi:hypothetical protein